MLDFHTAIAQCPIIPVVTLLRAEDAVPLAEALIAGGITTIEITLRTEAGPAAIAAVARASLAICVGAGTITTPLQLQQVADAGTQFAISPACQSALLDEAVKHSLTYLPGVVTPSEIAQAETAGYALQKFFPAAAFGGVATLKQYASVFPSVRFCPTGGISLENMNDYLALPNVVAVGGSWLAPADAIATGEWQRIQTTAQESVARLA